MLYFIYRNSHPEIFCKKSVLKNFVKFTGKHVCESLFFNIKSRLYNSCFTVNFFKIFRIFFTYNNSGGSYIVTLSLLLLHFPVKFGVSCMRACRINWSCEHFWQFFVDFWRFYASNSSFFYKINKNPDNMLNCNLLVFPRNYIYNSYIIPWSFFDKQFGKFCFAFKNINFFVTQVNCPKCYWPTNKMLATVKQTDISKTVNIDLSSISPPSFVLMALIKLILENWLLSPG